MAKTGRPTKYNKEVIRKCWEYLYIVRPSKDEHGHLDEVIPSIEGLSLHIDVQRSTIYEWMQEEPKSEFSDIVGKILAKQGKTLVNKGATGDFNPTISKLLLSKHKYRESIDVTSDEKPLDQNIADAITKVYGRPEPKPPGNLPTA